MSGSQNQGLYQFPCDTNLNVSMQYGGLSYTISTADMNLGRFTTNSDYCTGAFFQMDMWVLFACLVHPGNADYSQVIPIPNLMDRRCFILEERLLDLPV